MLQWAQGAWQKKSDGVRWGYSEDNISIIGLRKKLLEKVRNKLMQEID